MFVCLKSIFGNTSHCSLECIILDFSIPAIGFMGIHHPLVGICFVFWGSFLRPSLGHLLIIFASR